MVKPLTDDEPTVVWRIDWRRFAKALLAYWIEMLFYIIMMLAVLSVVYIFNIGGA